MKFIAGLRVWGNWEIGENVLKVFLKLRGSANRRVDLFLSLIASISGRRQRNASKCEMCRLGRVPPSAGRVVIDRKACYLSLLAQAAVWPLQLRISRTFLNKLRPQLSGHGYPAQRAANTSRPCSDRFWLLELRVSRTFLDNLRLICSGHGYPTQCAANTRCPRSGRFWLLELRVSQTFLGHLRLQLLRPWIPSSARGIDGGPRRLWGVERGALSPLLRLHWPPVGTRGETGHGRPLPGQRDSGWSGRGRQASSSHRDHRRAQARQ